MSLTSSSTLTDALNQYNDNLSWENDAAKAALALEAIRFLLINRPQRTGRESVAIDYADLAAEKEKLEKFISDQSSAVTSGGKGFKLTKLRPGGPRD